MHLELSKGQYIIDSFNINPIFCVKYKNNLDNIHNIFVRSWEDAYSLNKENSHKDISLAFLFNFITGNLSSDIAPFNNILRLPRSSIVDIENNENYKIIKDLKRNKTLNENYHSYKKIKDIFSGHLKNLIKDSPNILVEHSSGFDSNIIMATLTNNLDYDRKKIFSLTYEENESKGLLDDLRNSYNLLPCNINNLNREFNPKQFNKQIKLFGAPPQINHNLREMNLIKDSNCDLLLSGLGGDECLTHEGLNALNDLLIELNFKKIYQFHNNFYQSSKFIFKRIFELNIPLYKRLVKFQVVKQYWRKDLLIDYLKPEKKKILNNYRFKKNIKTKLDRIAESINNGLTSEYLSVRVEEETRIANFFNVKKDFPMLNLDLINYIQSLKPDLFIKTKNQIRTLGRLAFEDVIPSYFFDYPIKSRLTDNNDINFKKLSKKLINEVISLLEYNDHFHKYLLELIDVRNFIDDCKFCIDNQSSYVKNVYAVNISLKKLHMLNNWFFLLDD